MAIVGDYEYDYLKDSDVVTSQILVGLYFILLSTITLNLLVAMFTEAFIRINETAVANARLREAEEILEIERRFPEKKKEFEIYLNQYCAPLVSLDGLQIINKTYFPIQLFCQSIIEERN